MRADAAADFAAALDFGSLNTFAAAEAAFALVTSLLPAMIITSFPLAWLLARITFDRR